MTQSGARYSQSVYLVIQPLIDTTAPDKTTGEILDVKLSKRSADRLQSKHPGSRVVKITATK